MKALPSCALPPPGVALALDSGGTACRWALAAADGRLLAQGVLAPCQARQVADTAGRAALTQQLQALLQALQGQPTPARVWAGLTGLDPALRPAWADALGHTLGVAPTQVQVFSDIELACLACFAPGQGYVLVAGTGSIAGFIDAQGVWHRAGGRGVLFDDAGGGHWIATRALRQLWRAEDARPGAWQDRPLARRLLQHLGALPDGPCSPRADHLADHLADPPPDAAALWDHSRRWLARADRGQVGRLATAVAEVADHDPAARDLLRAAGTALARLAAALAQRFGPRPVVLAGRVWSLHPVIAESARQAIDAAWQQAGWPAAQVQALGEPIHLAAARRAALGQAAPWPPATFVAPPWP